MKDSADNLYYEYFVGKNFINKYTKIFPCFVETYDSYRLSADKWSLLATTPTNASFNDGGLTKYTGGFEDSCTDSKLLSVLIQHFDGSRFKSLEELTKTPNNYNIIQFDVLFICYQVMFVLSTLGSNYTHYDLHGGNVFCYKPYHGKKYIEMNYHLRDGTIISFPSEFIVKIIDYGRNYFNIDSENTPHILKYKICNNPKCDPACGDTKGYHYIQGNAYDNRKTMHDMQPNKPNQSHDLRFMKLVFGNIFDSWGIPINYARSFGTPEILASGLPRQINNIHDAKKLIERHRHNSIAEMTQYKYNATWSKAAIMHIYEDGRDYEFITL